MPTNTLPPTPYELDANVVALEFPDNFLLIDLCGEHDRNLADVELKLGVQVLRRGNQLTILGEPEAQKEAAEVMDKIGAKFGLTPSDRTRIRAEKPKSNASEEFLFGKRDRPKPKLEIAK